MLKPVKDPMFVTKPLLPTKKDFLNNLNIIFKKKWLTNNGEIHKKLEDKLEKYLKVSNLSLFNNGTTALLVALKSLNVTGEVITTPFTFAATIHSISWMGLKPVFVDIDPISLNINPGLIEKAITRKTTAILPVHVFGNPCNVKEIQNIADKHGLKVIYDAAHAFGTEINNEGIGNFGDISMFSFHATKLFNTVEGGALACKDSKLKVKIDRMKNFGIVSEEEVVFPGINGKMNEIQSAIGLSVLKKVDKERIKRKTLKETYIKHLKNISEITVMPDLPGIRNSYQYFVIRIKKNNSRISRDFLYNELKKFNIFTRKYFYPLCSNYSCYRNLPSATPKNLPVSNKVANEVLSLPFYGELTEHDIIQICEIIKYIYKH